MDFYEIEGKKVLEAAGIQTDHGFLMDEAADLRQISYPCVAKAQVLSGKRGKAGGIRIVETPEELRAAYRAISGMKIGGQPVAGVLVTPKADICEEHYLGLTIDRRDRSVLLMYSPCGGVDIEEVAAATPEKLLRFPISEKLDEAEFLEALSPFQPGEHKARMICEIGRKLHQAFVALDATTLEINPLAWTRDGTFVAIDCKFAMDDNALFRQRDHAILPRRQPLSREAELAASYGLSYAELDELGDVGVIAGGAGIGMATVDAIQYYGAKPFNFLDLGGGVSSEKMFHAMNLLLENPRVSCILVNVFGGINNCLTMAEGVCRAVRESGSRKMIVVKSRGYSQEAGWALYDTAGIRQVHYGTTDCAVKLLLELREGAEK